MTPSKSFAQLDAEASWVQHRHNALTRILWAAMGVVVIEFAAICVLVVRAVGK